MTDVCDLPDFDDHEGVHLFTDRASGLRAVIAVHSTHLGPAGGGARYWHYANSAAAVTDALRLSRGMSYKNALAGLAMGGGKGVIIADPAHPKSPELLRAFGRAIDQLGGAYVTAEDVGMSDQDMVTIATQTRHVSGLPALAGAAGGNPGPSTAQGVFLGVCAAAERVLGRAGVDGVHVAIQGLGSVGGGLARRLAAAGARLTIADVDAARARTLATELDASVVSPDAILGVEADLLSPCALGAILDASSIAALRVKAVAGAANNQLATPDDAARLAARGILYAPDYVINAGGIINVAMEYLGNGDAAAVAAKVAEIPARLVAIWNEASASGATPAAVADAMAQRAIGRD